MLSSAFALAPAARTGAPCKTECPRNDLTPRAVTPLRASLLSSRICLAGVGRCASWLIKPRERVLRCSSRLCFLRRILRGQPEFRGMRPATPTVSRNQYAPFRGSLMVCQFPSAAIGNSAIPLSPTLFGYYLADVKLFRLLLLAALPMALAACSSTSKKSKSSARMYDGDESPHIRMYTEAETPGSALHN